MADTVIIIAAQDEASEALQNLAGTFQKAGADIESGFGGSLKAVSGYMTEFAAVAGVSLSAGYLYDLAAGWQNTVFQMQATFGAGAQNMIQTAQELSEKTNSLFTTEDFAKSLAKVNDVLDQMGLTGEQQIGLVSAAADIAAARNLNLEDTVTGITKALSGAGKAGLQYGVTLKDNYMQTVAFGGSLQDTWTALSASDKEALRYQEFLIQAGKYSGDAAEKTKTFTGEIQSLRNAMKEAMTIGGPGDQRRNPIVFPGGEDAPQRWTA